MKKFVCIALAACFVVALVSFSASAAVENIVTPVSANSVFLEFNSTYADQFGYASYFTYTGNGFRMTTDLGISTPTAVYKSLVIGFPLDYTVPEYSGRGLSLSFNVDFLVSETGYLSYIPDDVDISNSSIFSDCFLRLFFTDGTFVNLDYDTFVLMDDDIGVVLDPDSDSYWNSIKGNIMDLSIYALFDVTAYSERSLMASYLIFPTSNIYYSNDDLNNYLYVQNIQANLDFAYSPFQDVVQDDLIDIKTQLGTIEQDVNRLEQSYSDLNNSINDFHQDLTSSDSSISSDISDKEDVINSIKDAMENDNSFLDNALNDMIIGFPDAEDPFHDAPSPDGFFAVDFIQQFWSFIKVQTVFFDFIFLGLCFCLATFILRR